MRSHCADDEVMEGDEGAVSATAAADDAGSATSGGCDSAHTVEIYAVYSWPGGESTGHLCNSLHRPGWSANSS